MSCKNICKLCDRLILTTNVAYAAGTLQLTIPAGTYNDGEKYCIVIAQAIPAATVLDAPVNIVISGGTTTYPLVSCDCVQVTARAVRTRTKYSTVVKTSPTTGSFKLLGRLCNMATNLTGINGTT